MIKEAMEWLSDLSNRAQKDRVIRPEAEPDHIYYLRHSDGSLERRDAELLPRRHELYTLEDLVDAIKRYRGGGTTVFAGNGRITALLADDDDARGRGRVGMELVFSHQFTKLRELDQRRGMISQKAFIDLLRIDLAGCVSVDTIDLFKSLKHTTSGETESSVSASAQQVSKKVLLECRSGGKDIPEQIFVNVSVYDNVPAVEQVVVQCVVSSDLANMQFALIPMAGEVSRGLRITDAAIVSELQRLLGEDAAVLAGKP